VNGFGQSRIQQVPRALKYLVGCFAVVVCSLSTAAQAGDWSFEGLTSSKLEYLNNARLVSSNAEDDVVSSSFGKGTLTYKTHDSQLDLSADVLVPHYFDYGAFSSVKFSDAHLSSAFTKNTKRGNFKLGASYARLADRYGNSSRFDECDPIPGTTLVDCNGEIFDRTQGADGTFQNVYNVNFGSNRRLDQRNSLFWDTGLSFVDFEKNSGPDSVAVTNRIGYERRLTKRTTGKLSAYANWQDIDNQQRTERWDYGITAKIDSTRSRRTVLHLETGVTLTNTSLTDVLLPGFPESSNGAFGAYVMAGADYRLDAVTSLTWSTRYAAREQTSGWRHTFQSAVGLKRDLNERASFNLSSSAQLAVNSGSGPANEVLSFNLAPALTYRLNKDWSFDTGYAFSLKDTSLGTAVSNSVYMSVSKKFVAR
jgi:hypothetical protein